ncbi:MAG: class I SAM-dependent methyltransferase, partial [Candidatus Saganbacteria bacterium]|nr:class I SAM-dependent methyltransferase [Candidatus Saganbacteria bacterium]
MKSRTPIQKTVDFITFPLRALTLFYDDRWQLSSLASERYDYVAGEVKGYCLDVGCGTNRFIKEFLEGQGKGIDLFLYAGMPQECLVRDLTVFPYENASFQTVTFIANINHIPKEERDQELLEAYRVLKNKGNIIVTMGNPLIEILAHKVVHLYDRIFKTNYDLDG